MSETIQCWQCGTQMTPSELAHNDGDCPECSAEVQLAEYLSKALAANQRLEGEVKRLRALEECVRPWFEAKQAHVKAVDDYNARLAFVKQHMPFGASVDPEYQIMEAANRTVRNLVWPMFLGLREIEDALSTASGEVTE